MSAELNPVEPTKEKTDFTGDDKDQVTKEKQESQVKLIDDAYDEPERPKPIETIKASLDSAKDVLPSLSLFKPREDSSTADAEASFPGGEKTEFNDIVSTITSEIGKRLNNESSLEEGTFDADSGKMEYAITPEMVSIKNDITDVFASIKPSEDSVVDILKATSEFVPFLKTEKSPTGHSFLQRGTHNPPFTTDQYYSSRVTTGDNPKGINYEELMIEDLSKHNGPISQRDFVESAVRLATNEEGTTDVPLTMMLLMNVSKNMAGVIRAPGQFGHAASEETGTTFPENTYSMDKIRDIWMRTELFDDELPLVQTDEVEWPPEHIRAAHFYHFYGALALETSFGHLGGGFAAPVERMLRDDHDDYFDPVVNGAGVAGRSTGMDVAQNLSERNRVRKIQPLDLEIPEAAANAINMLQEKVQSLYPGLNST